MVVVRYRRYYRRVPSLSLSLSLSLSCPCPCRNRRHYRYDREYLRSRIFLLIRFVISLLFRYSL